MSNYSSNAFNAIASVYLLFLQTFGVVSSTRLLPAAYQEDTSRDDVGAPTTEFVYAGTTGGRAVPLAIGTG